MDARSDSTFWTFLLEQHDRGEPKQTFSGKAFSILATAVVKFLFIMESKSLTQAVNNSSHPHPLNVDYQYLRLCKYYLARSTGADSNSATVRDNAKSSLTRPHVAIVCLDRPHKRNAMNSQMWKELGTLFGSVLGRTGDDCRAVILTSSSEHSFSAGIDISDPNFLMPKNGRNVYSNEDDADDLVRVGLAFVPKIQQMQDCFTALERCPVPVLAAISGPCIGAGVDLACCADVRLCSDEAFFSVREVALSLAADVGTLQRLPKIVGNESLVRELCLTGRNFTAKEALTIGFVSRVCRKDELLPQAIEICTLMAQHSPVAVQATKKALLYARDHSVADGLDQIAAYNTLALQGNDLETTWKARATNTLPHFRSIPPYSRL